MNRLLLIGVLTLLAALLYALRPILTPFVAGALIAYLADPLADRLEGWGLARVAAVVLVFAFMSLCVILVLLVVIPLLHDQITTFIEQLPVYGRWVRDQALPWLQRLLHQRLRIPELDGLGALVGAHWQQAGGAAASLLSSLGRSGGMVASWLLNLLLVPVVVFYLLRDWDDLVARVHDLLPRRWAPTAARLAREADVVLGAVFRGQLTVMVALGVIYSLGLWLVGVNLGLLIGSFAGAVSFIPYAGAALGLSLAALAALVQFGDIGPVIGVVAVFAVGQLVEGMFLTPWLIGEKAGLHPVAVIFSVLAGGQLFGFLGVLLALPAASVTMVLLRHVHELYRDSELYGKGSSLPALEPSDQEPQS